MSRRAVGRYRILRELGRGGMGTVYLAFDPELSRHVALKGLGSGQATEEKRQRLRREARAAASLTHPNIAQVYDVITQEDQDWVVMEYVEGKSLAEILEHGPLPPGEVARIGAQVARALAFAHHRGIVHRDVKTENVMLAADGTVKVLDFGLAQILSLPQDQRLTQEGLVVGTSRAMSPEQAMGKPLDHRSDIFSLGSLLYEAATGKPAFAGETVLETMHKVARAEYVPPQELVPELPAPLVEVIQRCLARDPEQRFQDAAEVAQILGESSRTLGTAVLAPVGRPTVLVRRLGRRLPWVVGALVLLSLLLGVAAWRGLFAAKKPRMVAVLPVSGEIPASSPLARTAIAEALSGFLANLQGLYVVADREVRAVYREQASVRELAAALGVEEVVEAVVGPGREPGTLAVQLRRLAGESGRILWSETLQVAANDLGAIQDRLATALADGLRGFGQRRPRRQPPPEALEAYLAVKKRLDEGQGSAGYQEELSLLAKAEAAAPDFPEPLLAHASIERFLATSSGDPQHFTRAQELLDRAEQVDPEHPELPLRRAQLLRAQGDAAAAATLLRELTRRRPGDPLAWATLGSALAALGQVEESEKAFARALALQPSITTLSTLASARADRGDFAGARQAAEAMLRRAPDHPLGLFRLGYVELLEGNFASCEKLFARLYPKTASLVDLLNWGTCAFYAGDLAKAEVLYRKAGEQAPQDPRPWANLGDVFLWRGEREQAQAFYAKALALLEAWPMPTRSDLYPHLLAHLGRLEDAIVAAQRAVAAAPERNWNLFVAAEVAAIAGDKTSMLAWAKKALERRAPHAWFAGPEFAPYRETPEFRRLFSR